MGGTPKDCAFGVPPPPTFPGKTRVYRAGVVLGTLELLPTGTYTQVDKARGHICKLSMNYMWEHLHLLLVLESNTGINVLFFSFLVLFSLDVVREGDSGDASPPNSRFLAHDFLLELNITVLV